MWHPTRPPCLPPLVLLFPLSSIFVCPSVLSFFSLSASSLFIPDLKDSLQTLAAPTKRVWNPTTYKSLTSHLQRFFCCCFDCWSSPTMKILADAHILFTHYQYKSQNSSQGTDESGGHDLKLARLFLCGSFTKFLHTFHIIAWLQTRFWSAKLPCHLAVPVLFWSTPHMLEVATCRRVINLLSLLWSTSHIQIHPDIKRLRWQPSEWKPKCDVMHELLKWWQKYRDLGTDSATTMTSGRSSLAE